MSKKSKRDDASFTDITNVMLDPGKSGIFGQTNNNIGNFHSSYGTDIIDPLKHDAHFASINKGYQSYEDIEKSRGVENLSFQEWTEKYHQ